MLCYVKSLQSCPTLCDPIDGSPPGSPVPGILQARTLEWVAVSFSNAWKWSRSVCPTHSDPMDCSLTGSSVHGIFQARVLEWGAIAFSELFTNDSHIPDFLSELHLYPIVCWRSWRWSLVAAFTSVCPKQKSSTSLQTYTSSQVLNLCETSRRQSFEMIISAHSPFLSTLPKFISWVFMPSCSHNPLIRFPIALSLIHSIFHVFY